MTVRSEMIANDGASGGRGNLAALAAFFAFSFALSFALGAIRPYMGAASIAYFSILLGVMSRSNRSLHMRLMSFGVALDLALVLALELQRGAVETVAAGKLTGLPLSHVVASSIAVALYLPAVLIGIARAKGILPRSWAGFHRGIGLTAFVFRTLGFLLMFSLLMRPPG